MQNADRTTFPGELLSTGPLPDSVEINGKYWPIQSDFRVGIRFEMEMERRRDDLVQQALTLYYPEIPTDVPAAVERLLWFYRCGAKEECSGEPPAGPLKPKSRTYCWREDAGMIYAAFWQAYRIDLTACRLHWWAFRALFWHLPPENEFRKAMSYRSMDTRGLSREQKKHMESMKKIYALSGGKEPSMSLEERNRQMLLYVDRRFAEANRQLQMDSGKEKEK